MHILFVGIDGVSWVLLEVAQEFRTAWGGVSSLVAGENGYRASPGDPLPVRASRRPFLHSPWLSTDSSPFLDDPLLRGV